MTQHSVLMVIRESGQHVLVIVFHGDSLERIENHDPAVVEGDAMARDLGVYGLPASMMDILMCFEESREEFVAFCKDKTPNEILKHLARGWENRPEEIVQKA